MKKSKKIIIGISAGILALILAAIIGVSNYLVSYAIMRGGDGGNREVALEVEETTDSVKLIINENKAAQKIKTEEFLSRVPEQSTSIQSKDGLKLMGFYFENPECPDWVITIHGYRSNHKAMRGYAQNFYDHGYNVLLPDLRSCGESEGNYVGMGWLDRKDILLWINWILEKNPSAKIIIHGVSMGGATTMMVSGENTPANVIGFVEDCGYTSVWDIFKSELKLRFHLPSFPILDGASIFAKLRAGYSFRQASSLKQLKKCEKPMMFIHGTADDFIDFSMMDEEFNAKAGTNKQKLVAPEAGHGDAKDVLGQTYWDTIFAFIDTL